MHFLQVSMLCACVSCVVGMSAGSLCVHTHVTISSAMSMGYSLLIYWTEREQLILRTTGGKQGKEKKTTQPCVALF